jgi:hypothetical protein
MINKTVLTKFLREPAQAFLTTKNLFGFFVFKQKIAVFEKILSMYFFIQSMMGFNRFIFEMREISGELVLPATDPLKQNI